MWFEHAVPAIGRLAPMPDAYRYLPDSVEYLPSPERLRLILRDAGFRAVGRRTFVMGAAQLFTATRAAGAPGAASEPGDATEQHSSPGLVG